MASTWTPPAEVELVEDDLSGWKPPDNVELVDSSAEANVGATGLTDAQREELMRLRRQGAAEATSKVPAVVREPFYAAGRAGAKMMSTVTRPFSKDAGDYFAKMGEVVSTESEAVRKDDWFPAFSRMYGGASESMIQATTLGPGGLPAMTAGFALTEANDALYEAEKAGLKGNDRLKYAAVQGAIEGGVMSVFNKFGIPGLEGLVPQIAAGTMKNVGKEFLKATAQELPEEIITELGHALAESQFGVNPNAMDQEQLVQRMIDTVGQTVLTVGMASAAGRASQNKGIVDTPPNDQAADSSRNQIQQRLDQLQQIRAKGFVAETDGIEGANRKERMANLRQEEQQLQQELQNEVQPATAPEAEGQGEVQVPAQAQPAGEVAPEVQVTPGSLAVLREFAGQMQPYLVESIQGDKVTLFDHDTGETIEREASDLVPAPEEELGKLYPRQQDAIARRRSAISESVPQTGDFVEHEGQQFMVNGTMPSGELMLQDDTGQLNRIVPPNEVTPDRSAALDALAAAEAAAPAEAPPVEAPSPELPQIQEPVARPQGEAIPPRESAIATPSEPVADQKTEPMVPKTPPAQIGNIRLEDVQKSFPGATLAAPQDGKEGWDVTLPAGQQVKIRVHGGFKLGDAQLDKIEESYGRKFTPEQREQMKKRANIAGFAGIQVSDGESMSPTAIIRLHRKLANPKTLSHEATHIAWKLMWTAEEKQKLVERFSSPSAPESQQEEEVVRGVNGDPKLKNKTRGQIREFLQKILDAIGLGGMTAEEAKALLESEQFWSRGEKKEIGKKAKKPAVHYTGISIADVLAKTGLSKTDPGLTNVGLPRETDPQVGDEIGDRSVVAVWRTATAKEDDGELHVTLRDKSGKREGFTGRAAEKLRQQESKPASKKSIRKDQPAAPEVASEPAKTKHHVAEYGGKSVVIDYVENKKDEFKRAAQRVRDNLKTGEVGYVTAPDGKRYEISTSSKKAKLVEPASQPTPKAEAPKEAEPEKPTTQYKRNSSLSEDEKKHHQDMMQQSRERELELTKKRDEVQKEHDRTRRNAYKKKGALQGQIRELNKLIGGHQRTFNEHQNALQLDALEDYLEKAPSETHLHAGLAEQAELHYLRWESTGKDRDLAKKFYDVRAGHEHNVQAAFHQEAQKLSDQFNADEITAIAEHARRGFSVNSRSTVAQLVETYATKQKEARSDLPPPLGAELSEEQKDSFHARLKEAAQGGKDWRKEYDAIVKEAHEANTVARQENQKKAAADAKERAEAAIAAARELAAERRAKRKEQASQERYFRQARERSKKLKGEVFGKWKIVENKNAAKDEPKFTITHIPTDLSLTGTDKIGDAKLLIQMIDDAGIEIPDAEPKADDPEMKRLKELLQIWDTEYFADSDVGKHLAGMVEIPEAGVTGDIVLDASDLIPKGQSDITPRLKQFIREVQEFAYNPVFTVNDDRKLVFKDGFKFELNPEFVGLDSSLVEPGQTVALNLPDVGIQRPTPEALVKDVLGRDFAVKSGGKKGGLLLRRLGKPNGDAIQVSGGGQNWAITRGMETIDGKRAQQLLDGISWIRSEQIEKNQDAAGVSKLQSAADAALQDAVDTAKALNKKVRGKGAGANPFLDPEILLGASKVVAKFAKAGVYQFAAMTEHLAKTIGQKALDTIHGALEVEWDKAVAAGEFPKLEARVKKSTIVDTGSDDLTSIKKAVVNEMREMVGLPEMEGSTPQTVEEWAEQARLTLKSDPDAAKDLVSELATNPRPISQHDAMLLQFRYRELANQLKPVVDKYFKAVESKDPVKIAVATTDVIKARGEMSAFEEAIHPSKETWGRTGVALQQMMRRDMSLEAVLRRGQESNQGHALSAKQTAELTELSQKFEALQKQFDESRRQSEERERELASQRQHEQAVKEVKQRNVRRKSEKRQKVDAKIAAAWDKVRSIGKGKLYSIEGLATDAVSAATDLIKAYTELGIVSFGEFMANVRKALGVTDAAKAQANFKSVWDHLKEQGEIPTIDLSDRAELTRLARQMQKRLVESGMTDREQVIDAVHEILAEDEPGFTRRQTMDALSRYGQFQTHSKDEIETILRGMNAEILKLSQIDQQEIAMRRVEELRKEGKTDEEIGNALQRENLLVAATGLVRDNPSETVRQLTKQYNENKKAIPASSEGRSSLLQTAISAIERGLLNRIEDLNYEIENGPIVRQKRERPTTERIQALEAERDRLREIHREMFPPTKKTMTEAQRIAAAIRGADKAIEHIEKQLKTRDFDTTKRDPLSSPELDAKRARLDQLRAAREAAKAFELSQFEGEGGTVPKGKIPLTKEEIARRVYEANLRKRIADFQKTLAEGDFAPQPKKGPRTLSESELKLKREMEDVRLEVLDKFAEYHLAHLHGLAWTADKIREAAHLSRALMTSFDMSALLRQGGLAAMGHPILAKRALVETVASIARTFDKSKAFDTQNFKWSELEQFLTGIDSREAEFEFMHKLTSGKEGEFRLAAKLNLPSTDSAITKQEEAIAGRWGKKVPGIAVSSRLYTMILNKMRADLFDSMIQNLGRNGQVTMEQAKVIANFVNVATGRADLGRFNGYAAALNLVFFAPRYVASRFQYLAIPFYLPFQGGLKADWQVKRAIYKEYARTAAGIGTLLGAVALAAQLLWDDDDEDKPTIETDPHSTDFLKVKVGETRLDFLAGLSQAAVFATQFTHGQTKSSVTGKTKQLGGKKYKADTRADVALKFIRTKTAPVPGAVWTIADDWTNVVGGKETPGSLATSLVTPLSLRDVVTTMEAQGIPKGTAMSLLSILGVGMNTYGPKTEKRKKQALKKP